MTDRGWGRPFDDPIKVPGGKLVTLRDAGENIAGLLPDDPIKAAARYTTKYLIFHLGAYPATPNANAHIVAPHTALGLRIRDAPIVACLVVIGAFGQTSCKAKSLAFGKCRFLGDCERRRCRRNIKGERECAL